jgi:hypothetical protein
MVPKSLPHQTLAKLFSETDRLFLFFSFSINSTESIIAESGIFVKRFVVLLKYNTTKCYFSANVMPKCF